MSMHGKCLATVFLMAMALAACGESPTSPTSPTSPLPPVQTGPWTGGDGILWAERSNPTAGQSPSSNGEEGGQAPVATADSEATGGASGIRDPGIRRVDRP